ncbi:MAG: PilZ domain-containing protein [Planctomycetota bacterium]|nr:MAG: PilZ domain-containing protein [Planctomycetota bacterium]
MTPSAPVELRPRFISHTAVRAVLARAVDERVEVRWRPLGGTIATGRSARLVHADGESVTLEADEATGDDEMIAGETTVLVRLTVDGVSYRFETRYLDRRIEEGACWVRLRRPKVLLLVDRRRRPRCRLHRPTLVTLQSQSRPDAWWCQAVMLNVSPDGLACRMPTAAASQLQPGDRLWARFRLDGVERSFVFDARVVSVIEAGEPQRSVVGLAFLESPQGSDLREALDAALRDRMEMEETR